MSDEHVDWDRIEQEYVDYGVEQVGEPIIPTRALGMNDIEDIFADRPLADDPRPQDRDDMEDRRNRRSG